MIEAVQERIERNARELFTGDEITALEKPERVNDYVSEVASGPVVATRTQHRLGEDGSGGGFKIVEVAPTMPVEEMLRQSRQQSLGLGTLMTLKGDLIELDLPEGFGNDFGGAKGVMLVPAGTLPTHDKPSRFVLDKILSNYVVTQEKKQVLGLGIDRHAPDMNTGAPDMDVMAHTLVRHTKNERARAAFSGKSIEAGGLEGREIATAQGLVYTLAKHLETLGLDPKRTTIAVQGSGNVGYHFARLATEQLSVKVVGISDRYHAVVSDANKPLQMGETVTFENRLISGWDESAHHTLNNPDDLLGMEVDVLVFAAMPDSVTEDRGNKEQIKARVVLQGANNPIDSEGIDYLVANGTSVLADIHGNAGGFVASNFEYNQGMTGVHWTEAMAMSALKRVMDDAYARVLAEADDTDNMVDPAFRVALKRRYERDHARSGLYVSA
jgi:glutamate dehydrogenase/leucine dehydrogenase